MCRVRLSISPVKQRNGFITERLRASVERVLRAKERLGLFRRRLVDLAVIPRQVGGRDERETAAMVGSAKSAFVWHTSGSADVLSEVFGSRPNRTSPKSSKRDSNGRASGVKR